MAKSSGIPYFCGERLAHNARITDMTATIQPVIKIFPRNIGGVIKGGGIVEKSITVECRIIPPPNTSRADLEEFMNVYNEKFGPMKGSLFIDNNHYSDCGINNIKYDTKLTNGYLLATVDFAIGVQSETDTLSQLVPSRLFADTRGRPGVFTTVEGEGVDAVTKTFNIWHNMDIVRDLENRLVMELYDIHKKDQSIKFNGGFETITAYCWMKAPEENGVEKEDGWMQTVGSYIYNIMNGPLGEMGTLKLGGKTIEHCLWTQVKLTEVYPTSARYELTFIVGLQC
jgi:hypothetical protein